MSNYLIITLITIITIIFCAFCTSTKPNKLNDERIVLRCQECNNGNCIYNTTSYDVIRCECEFGICGDHCDKKFYSKMKIINDLNFPFIGLSIWRYFGVSYGNIWYTIVFYMFILLYLFYLFFTLIMTLLIIIINVCRINVVTENEENNLIIFVIIFSIYMIPIIIYNELLRRLNNLEDIVYCL
jgi:hypothetical protein